MQWMVELGHADIFLEVYMISYHLTTTREGHLEQLLHMFSHLKK